MIKQGFTVVPLILAVAAFDATLAQAAEAFPVKPIRIIVPAAPGGD